MLIGGGGGGRLSLLMEGGLLVLFRRIRLILCRFGGVGVGVARCAC